MKKNILIIGGAGFIGINAARHFLKKGWEVTIFDNFSRRGTDYNVRELKREFKKGVKVIHGDVVTDLKKLEVAVKTADAVIHLAAQVAVTTSITDPRKDMEINIIGTFNVLEAIRASKHQPPLLYSSTNKVYGALEHHDVVEGEKRYRFKSSALNKYGVSEDEKLDFHSPYGCSKGSAAEYVIDYSRIYGLKTVVFHQSCIYGAHQFGIEDQGWVAWFTIATLLNRPLTLYGTGKQVRDLLFVDDLVDLYDRALARINKVKGTAYNIGGGPKNTLSLLELIQRLEEHHGPMAYKRSKIRAGDQPIFVADIRKAKEDLGWEPKVGVDEGFKRMRDWIVEHKDAVLSSFLA